jgi:membrane associated rhomboid family serine protease
VNDGSPKEDDLPVWARPEAFPRAPGGWGWVDYKSRLHPCESLEGLIRIIREDRDAGVALVWMPEEERMILPEELPGAEDAVFSSRSRRAKDDLADSIEKLRWFGWLLGGLSAYMLYQGWSIAPRMASAPERAVFALRGLVSSMSMGITLLMFLIFAFIPWYQARKRIREINHWTAGDLVGIVPVLRFETWLEWQKSPVTRYLLGLIIVVGIAQLMPGDSLAAAGLLKARYFQGEWWRLFTAPFMHGNPIHFLMNAAALLYLGKRLEVFASWPHVPLVFLFSACIGGEASARFIQTSAISVGASGGLMGWLGFLLVFESLHGGLVPRSARRRLLAGVFVTGLIGLIGYRFIDNAAHIGGLIAGMIYAVIVFPKSNSLERPRSNITDRIAGSAALVVLTFSAIFAATRILFK